jgi:hypothetical protein
MGKREDAQSPLWAEPTPRVHLGEVRRALDRDIRAAEDGGREFLGSDKAALRRQANDLDRLERMLATADEVRTWDYQPKTAAHQAFAEAVRRFFGKDDGDDDPFVRAVAELEDRARAAEALDAEGPPPPD